MLTNTIRHAVGPMSPRLLQIGGLLLAGHAITSGIKAFTQISPPPDLFVTTGHLVALVGLLSLYPLFDTDAPRLSTLALGTGIVGVFGWLVMTGAQTLVAIGSAPAIGAVLPGAFIGLLLLSTILAYGLFFAAASHVAWLSRRERLLVVAPGSLIVVLTVDSAVTGASNVDGLLIGGALAVSMFALGRTIQTGRKTLRSGAPFEAALEG